MGELSVSESQAGIQYMSHGCSPLHIYFSFGGANFGRRGGSSLVANFSPSSFYTFDSVLLEELANFLSMKQVVVARLLPMLLASSKIENACLGGWSLGALFTLYACLEVEGCLTCARAAFSVDPRTLPPNVLDTSFVISRMEVVEALRNRELNARAQQVS